MSTASPAATAPTTPPTSPTRALIADDEPHLARHLHTQLGALWPELQVAHIARNGIEAAERIAALDPDIAFLDIQMPGLTGLEVAQGIEGRTRVVFVTAFDEFAVQAFEQEAIDYVLKPVTTERLRRCVERARRQLASQAEEGRLATVLRRLLPAPAAPPSAASVAGGASSADGAGAPPGPLRWLRAGQGDVTTQIDVRDVLFFHADDKYTCVRMAGAEHLIRVPIAQLALQLDPGQFWQVHRSTIVNLAHLAGTRRDDASRLWLRLRGHAGELAVARAYTHLFKAM